VAASEVLPDPQTPVGAEAQTKVGVAG